MLVGCANAGKDKRVVSNATVVLDANASKADFHGEIKKYKWKQIQGKHVHLSHKNSIQANFVAPSVTEESRLVFRLTTIEKGGYYSPWKTTDTVTVLVEPSTSTHTPPVAKAEVNASSIKYGDSVTFDANHSIDSDGQIVSYAWKDEDNITLGTEATVTHIFDTIGVHTVRLIVTDDDGLSDTDSVSVTVQALQKPIAVIHASGQTVAIGQSISFDANSSNDADGQIVSYQWLDDTNTTLSNQKSFSHTFETSGEHNITLVVTDDDGQVGRASIVITIEALLTSLSLDADSISLEVNETTTLLATAHYSDNTTQNVNASVVWLVADTNILTVDANGTVKAHKNGITTIQAKVGEMVSNTLTFEVKNPLLLQSISVSPSPVNLRVGNSVEVKVTGLYSDGSTQNIEGADYSVADTNIASVDDAGNIDGLGEGNTTLSIQAGAFTTSVSVVVAKELNTTNFNFTHFGNAYIDQIPIDATVDSYDEKRFCMIAGQILSEDGSPLQGVRVSIHKHSEYGTTLTDSNGTYTIPAEGGLQLTVRYTKEGYTTIDRKVQAPVQDWVRAEDVTMLAVDTKVTTIDLNDTTPQIHISTPVTDDRGERSTTLVFDGVTKATVTAPDGSTRELTSIDVRATEFRTPESMPGDLPRQIGFTYCSDIKVDGVSDDENVTFDAPVVMYVENFIGFPAGGIVPVGYYDRNQAKWIGSKNGIVIKLLDTDGDGIVDALDSNDSGTPNDLDGDGSFTDEVAGIAGNAKYKPGETFWRVEVTHFTPWDHNWPWPEGTSPDDDDVDPDTDSDVPNDCTVPINSYVTSKSRIFHEDIPIAGTNQTLHYSSKRTQGYKHIVTVTVDTSDVYTTVWSAIIRLSIGGRIFEKEYNTGGIVEAKFEWDGLDAIGRPYLGNAKGTITVGYRNLTQYLPPKQEGEISWGKAVSDALHDLWEGGCLNCSIGWRILWGNPKSVQFYNEDLSELGHGWSISNHDRAFGDMLLRGNGKVEKKKITLLDNDLVVFAGNSDPFAENSGDGETAINAGLDFPRDITMDSDGNLYIVAGESIRKVDKSGIITTVVEAQEHIGKVAVDNNMNMYYGLGGRAIYRLNLRSGDIDTFISYYEDIDDTALVKNLLSYGYGVRALQFNKFTNKLYISLDASEIYEIDLNTNIAKKIAGLPWGTSGFSGDGGLATEAMFYAIRDIAFDSKGNVYIADAWNNRIRKINTSGIIDTVVGNGEDGDCDDWEREEDGGCPSASRGLALSITLLKPRAISIDSSNMLYIADTDNGRIYLMDNSGYITRIKSNIYAYDLLWSPQGDLLITDPYNGRIMIQRNLSVFSKYGDIHNSLFYKNANNTADIFDITGKHLKAVDLNTGKSLKEFGYDENNHLITITDQFNQTITIQRDANGHPTSITAPNGQVTTLTIDENGDLIQVGYEDNSHYTFVYDSGSLMTQETDPNGNLFVHTFDADGRIVKDTDAINGVWEFAKSKNGKTTTYTMTKPEGEQTVSMDTREDNGTTTSSVTYPSGDALVSTTSYDGKSVATVRDGVTTVRTYGADSFTHQKILAGMSTTQPSGLKQTIAYATAYDGNETHTNTKTQTSTTNGKTTTLLHDYNNGTETLTTPAHRVSTRAYDITTRLTSEITTGSLLPATYSYDTQGRLTAETTGDRETSYTYDSRGNLATITDPRGQTSTYTYDIMDRLTTLTHPNGTQEHFTYDANGNLLTRTVPTPADHVFAYNGVDARTSTTSPLHKTTTYTYDKSRHLTQVTKPSGKTIAHTYTNGRLTSTTTNEGTTTYSYLFADKVGSITKGSESFSFTYDGTLLTGITQSGILNQAIATTYNNDFQVASSTYAGQTENYSYDDDGLLTASGAYTLTRDAANGFVTTITDGTLTQHRSYNGYGEITQVSDDTFTYELSQRDKSGAIAQKRETLHGTTETFDYSYDEMGRLTKVKRNNTLVESYTYDPNGNRASATINGTTTTASYTLDDQLVVYGDNAYRYDDDGYLQTKTTPEGETTYSYSTMGELLSVSTPAKTITYKHNALNQRVAKLVDGVVVEKYLWANLTTLLAVYDADDTLIQRFEYADQRMPVAMTDTNNTKYYLHYDQVGSLRAVSDSSHNIVKEIVYDTFGNILNDTNPSLKVPFGFAGGLYDHDTKLTRFGYRDYDAYTGKWTAKDPIGFAGGDSNLYGYVLGDPVNLVDPRGESWNNAGSIENSNYSEVCVLENCSDEWARARTICAAQIGGPNKGVTGGYMTVEQCARGLVSMRCGGNSI